MDRCPIPKIAHFFSMNDLAMKPVPVLHREYTGAVEQYFHTLFPNRKRTVLADTEPVPLPVDIEILYPTTEEPFYVIHTLGMSATPMTYPEGTESGDVRESYSELCLMLPSDWPFAHDRILSMGERAAWPLRMIRDLAKFPHAHHLWMSYGFILPNSESNEPFTTESDLCGVLMVQFDGELGELTLDDGIIIQLLMPVLLYADELEAYDRLGPDALIERILDCTHESFLLDLHRSHVAQGLLK